MDSYTVRLHSASKLLLATVAVCGEYVRKVKKLHE